MMAHVLLLQIKRELAMKAEVMEGIMRQVINEITRNESREEGRQELAPKNGPKEKVEKDCQRNTDDRRHNESR